MISAIQLRNSFISMCGWALELISSLLYKGILFSLSRPAFSSHQHFASSQSFRSRQNLPFISNPRISTSSIEAGNILRSTSNNLNLVTVRCANFCHSFRHVFLKDLRLCWRSCFCLESCCSRNSHRNCCWWCLVCIYIFFYVIFFFSFFFFHSYQSY